MNQVKNDTMCEPKRIRLKYTLSTDDEVLEATPEGGIWLDPALGRLPKLLAQRIESLAIGESFSLTLDADLAFGAVRQDLMFAMARAKLPPHVEVLELGDGFEGLGPDRKRHLFRVVEKTPKRMSFDGNHPWAGMAVYIEGEILEVDRLAANEATVEAKSL